MMKRRRILPDRQRPQIDSNDLQRMGQLISKRMVMTCPGCSEILRPSCEGGELQIGSSPDMTGVNNNQQSMPRLIFQCKRCFRIAGWIQGDVWVQEFDLDDDESRWDHLELDDHPMGERLPE